MRIGRAQAIEQLERLVDDPFGPRAGTVDLVDDDDRPQALLQRLQRDEPRLRHRAFDGVDEQQHAVDHAQHALDLAAEIRVARRVDDVDVNDLVLADVTDRAVLREDRDAALALDVVVVHHPLADVEVLGERARLHQQLVDERGLAVVDVRDDRDVPKVVAKLGHESVSRAGSRAAPAKQSIIAGRATLSKKYFEKSVS